MYDNLNKIFCRGHKNKQNRVHLKVNVTFIYDAFLFINKYLQNVQLKTEQLIKQAAPMLREVSAFAANVVAIGRHTIMGGTICFDVFLKIEI